MYNVLKILLSLHNKVFFQNFKKSPSPAMKEKKIEKFSFPIELVNLQQHYSFLSNMNPED